MYFISNIWYIPQKMLQRIQFGRRGGQWNGLSLLIQLSEPFSLNMLLLGLSSVEKLLHIEKRCLIARTRTMKRHNKWARLEALTGNNLNLSSKDVIVEYGVSQWEEAVRLVRNYEYLDEDQTEKALQTIWLFFHLDVVFHYLLYRPLPLINQRSKPFSHVCFSTNMYF